MSSDDDFDPFWSALEREAARRPNVLPFSASGPAPLPAEVQQQYSGLRYFDGLGWCGLNRYIFTTAICCGLDYCGMSHRYCYEMECEARDALERWDGHGDPPGPWIVCKGLDKDRVNPEVRNG